MFDKDVTKWNICACTDFYAMFLFSGYSYSGFQSSTSECTSCPSGRYTEGTGEYVSGGRPCTACQAGKHSETEGSKSCKECEAGKFSTAASSYCTEECPPGTYSIAASSKCEDCEAGKYSEAVGASIASACEECEEGKSSAPGSSICRSACIGTSNPTNDGSDGNIYCIHGGEVGETRGICTCSSCNFGFGGLNCATCAIGFKGSNCNIADPCVATPAPTDDGSDGNFYCINGGDVGGTTGSCTCTSCDTGYWGESCQNTKHHIAGMPDLFNTIGNGFDNSLGSSIMENGDTAVLALAEYKCSDGSCTESSTMLLTNNLYGEISCIEDDAMCVLHGETERRLLFVSGSGRQKLVVRAITFQDGKGDRGGGIWIKNKDAKVDLELCFFSNCYAHDGDLGGGAIYIANDAGIIVNIKGTSFSENLAIDGADIYKDGGPFGSAIINVHATCPSPYTANSPTKGKQGARSPLNKSNAYPPLS